MSLADAFLDDEDPATALDRLGAETEEQAAEAFAQIVELVAVINAELSQAPEPTASASQLAGSQWAVDYGPSQLASLQVTAALARVGVKASILDKLKKWLNKLQAKLKQIAGVQGRVVHDRRERPGANIGVGQHHVQPLRQRCLQWPCANGVTLG